jgi:hypothetical protein
LGLGMGGVRPRAPRRCLIWGPADDGYECATG